MWKKEEGTSPVNTPMPAPEERPVRRDPHPTSAPEPSRGGVGERASIGRSITIRGDVTGEEDLLIQGRVEGSVDLQQQAVIVGREGRVKANIIGRVVTVEGEVEGDLTAQEQVILRGSARVQGDITAPRVVLEDGANFRGLVDMGGPLEAAKPGPAPHKGADAGKAMATTGAKDSANEGTTPGKGGGESSPKVGATGKDLSGSAEKAAT